MRVRQASLIALFALISAVWAIPASASVELCSELMIESYELEEFEPFLEEWEVIQESHGALETLSQATERVANTSELISEDVFSNKYERELARSVKTAAGDMETALEKVDTDHLYPAYEVLMETIDYLTGACFAEEEQPAKKPAEKSSDDNS